MGCVRSVLLEAIPKAVRAGVACCCCALQLQGRVRGSGAVGCVPLTSSLATLPVLLWCLLWECFLHLSGMNSVGTRSSSE